MCRQDSPPVALVAPQSLHLILGMDGQGRVALALYKMHYPNEMTINVVGGLDGAGGVGGGGLSGSGLGSSAPPPPFHLSPPFFSLSLSVSVCLSLPLSLSLSVSLPLPCCLYLCLCLSVSVSLSLSLSLSLPPSLSPPGTEHRPNLVPSVSQCLHQRRARFCMYRGGGGGDQVVSERKGNKMGFGHHNISRAGQRNLFSRTWKCSESQQR